MTFTEWIRVSIPVAGIGACLALTAAAQNPAGWQVLKDRKQMCQIAVPPDWTADKIMPSNVTSPDKKANVIFGSKPASVDYATIVKMAKDMFKPSKTIEDTANRTWFVASPDRGKAGPKWYVALPTSPVCEAQITFEDAPFEATAKQMVNSLKSAK
jgi:hypothetical protein